MTPSPVPTRPAASVLLLRDGASGLEVFMIVRNHQSAFAPGARVFPGGRVDATDACLADLSASSEFPPDSLPFRVAAIRETYEECGILLARPQGERSLISAQRLAAFAPISNATHETPDEFAALLEREKLSLALDLLVHYSHWIAPVVAPIRYDTHFYLAAMPPDQIGRHDGTEAIDSLWVSPAQVLVDADAGRCRLEFPTRMHLRLLKESSSVAEAFAAARARKIVTVLPEVTGTDMKRFTVRIPLEAGYGGEIFVVE